MHYLTKIMAPLTQVKFVHLMKSSLSIKVDYNKFRYEEYYFALLKYMQDYELLFKLLAEDNADIVPDVNDKANGLIQLFGYHIDKKFFDDTKTYIREKKFKSIYDFLKKFRDALNSYHKAYLNFKIIPQHNNVNQGTDRKQSFVNHHADKANTSHENKFKHGGTLSHMKQEVLSDSLTLDSTCDDSEGEQVTPWFDSEDNIESDEEKLNISDQQATDSLNMVTFGNSTTIEPTSNKVCMFMVQENHCTYADDPKHMKLYSHDPALVRKKQLEVHEMFKSLLSNPSPLSRNDHNNNSNSNNKMVNGILKKRDK
jgi:hypothetical protein